MKLKTDISTTTGPAYESVSIGLPDATETTIHVAVYPRRLFEPRVMVFPRATRLLDWCGRTGHRYAMTGGFFSRSAARPLGRTWMSGLAVDAEPFGKDWSDERGALFADGPEVKIAPLKDMPAEPRGDLLTAGPILVREGESVVGLEYHYEGIPETWLGELDDDWTELRAQRTAIGLDADRFWSVAADGPVTGGSVREEAGLTIRELATVMEALGCTEALNLDGGGGSTLIFDGRLVNRPVAGTHDAGHSPGDPLKRGRPIHTAVVFEQK